MKFRKLFFSTFIILLTFTVGTSYGSRVSTLPQPGVKTLASHLTDIDNNFKELYRLIFAAESGYTGLGAGIITSGVLSDARIPDGITRDTELTSGLATKQNASVNLTTFAGIAPAANVISILTAADYPAIKALLDLEVGTDFYSISTVDSLLSNKQTLNFHLTDLADGSLTGSKIGTGIIGDYITSGTIPDAVIPSAITRDSELTAGLATKQDINTHLTDLTDGSLTGSKVGTGISATNVTTGTLPDAVIPSTITRDTELTTALGSYTTTSALTTLLSGKMNVATGTPDGTKFLRDDLTWQTIAAGGGSNYDLNSDGFIDDEFILSGITRDSELTTTLSSYVLSSVLDDYVTTTTLSTNLNNYISSSALTTILSDYVLTSALSSYVTSASLTTTLNNYVLNNSNASFSSISSAGPITSTGGADGTRGIWFSSSNTVTPNTSTYPDGIYLGTTSLIGRYAGVDYDLLAAGGGSVSVDSVVVNNPNFDSNGTVDVSASGSNISASVKNNVLTTGNLTADTLVTAAEVVPNTDTAILTAAAVNKLIDHKVNERLAASGFTIANLLNPLTSPTNVSNSSFTVSGDVYDAGTTPVVTVSLNSGTYESAIVTGSTSPWTWSRLLTLISGNNTIDVRVTASDNDIINLPQAIVNYTPPDTTNPVVGAITPSTLTHDGTGVTLTASIASIVEANEDYRQWSLYDVTDAAIQTDWTTFTGLSISGITIPADQHTYRVDVRAYDLAGNVGTASSANIVYEAVEVYPVFQWNLDDNAASSTVLATYGSNATYYVGTTETNTSTAHNETTYCEGTGSFKLPAGGGIRFATGTMFNDGIFTIQFAVNGDGNGSQTEYPRFFEDSTGNHLLISRYTSDTTMGLYVAGTYLGPVTVADMADGQWQTFRLVFNYGGAGDDIKVYQKTGAGSFVERGSIASFTLPTLGFTAKFFSSASGINSWGSDTNNYYADQVIVWDSAVYP